MSRPVRVRVKLSALQHNLERVRFLAPQSKICSIIKANGYGHGIVQVAKALRRSDAFGVACLEEAEQLRQCGISKPILLLEGVFSQSELDSVSRHKLTIAVHNEQQIHWLESHHADTKLSVWLKINTGMNRLGFNQEQIKPIFKRLLLCSCVNKDIKLMTHLACADEPENSYSKQQLEKFAKVLQGIKGERSIANSAGIMAWPSSHVEWVRPGIMLYGVSPFRNALGKRESLQTAMSLHSELIAVQSLKKGQAVGYGGNWTCPLDMRVGVVAIGYGDGYPRHATNGTPVIVNNKAVQLVGKVSMDMLTVDLRKVPQANVGDVVELWGETLPVEEVARWAATIAYELLCAVTARVHFDYE